MDEAERRDLIDLYTDPGRDRSPPLVFAGRAQELEWLNMKLISSKRDGTGVSAVIHGIPGCGKTALAVEFCRRAEEQNDVMVVSAAGEEFAGVRSLVGAIAARFVDVQTEKRKALLKGERKQSSAFLARVAAEETLKAVREFLARSSFEVGIPGLVQRQPKQTDTKATEMLSAALSQCCVPRDQTIIVFVDEAQNMPDEAKPLVSRLHLGVPGWSILPIYAGTDPRLPDRFSAMVSRPAARALRPIGALRLKDARASIDGACRAFGAHDKVRHQVVPLLAQETHGFPAHIASAVCAVACTMKDSDYRFPASKVSDCVTEAKSLRSVYYDARLSSAGKPPIAMLAPLARASRNAEGGWVAESSVQAEYDEARSRSESRRPLPELPDLLDKCQRAGAMWLKEVGPNNTPMFRFAAPSLAEEIIDRDLANRRDGVGAGC